MLSDNQADPPELVKLIEIEIDLANTFLRTFQLASHQEHKAQALQNAMKAVQTGKRFLSRLSSSGRKEELALQFGKTETKIDSSLDSFPGELPLTLSELRSSIE